MCVLQKYTQFTRKYIVLVNLEDVRKKEDKKRLAYHAQPATAIIWWMSCAYFCKTCNVCSVHVIYTIFYTTLFSVYKSLFNIHLSPIFESSPVYFFVSDLQCLSYWWHCFNIRVSLLFSIPFDVNSFQPLFTSPLCYWLLSRLVSLLASCLFSKLSSTLKAGALIIWYLSNHRTGTCFHKWNNARIKYLRALF